MNGKQIKQRQESIDRLVKQFKDRAAEGDFFWAMSGVEELVVSAYEEGRSLGYDEGYEDNNGGYE